MWIFLLVLLAAAILAQRYSLRHGLDRVAYDCMPSCRTVDPDEPFDIVSSLSNGRRTPVFFVRVQEFLPSETHILSSGADARYGRDMLRLYFTCYLRPRQRLTRRVRASLPQRGRYFLRGALLSGGDFLGLSETTRRVSLLREIVVLPAPAPRPDLPQTLGGYLGERSVNRFILEDPVLTLGFREYTGREAQKAISWPVSARLGRLMVRKPDFTLEQTVTVLLNIECTDNGLDPDAPRIEQCFSLARSVCEVLEARHVAYSFLTNATSAGAVGLCGDIGDGLGRAHLGTILEGLGRATYARTEPFDATLSRALRRTMTGRAHILITARPAECYRRSLMRLQQACGQETLVLTPAPPPDKEACS